MSDRDHLVQQTLLPLRIMGGAFLMGLLMFAGVIVFLYDSGSLSPISPELEILGIISAGLAALLVFLSVVIGPMIARSASTAGIDQRLAAIKRATILRYAMCEGPALLGLVTVLLTGKWMPAGLAIGLGLAGIVLSIPGRAGIEAVFDDAERQA